MRRPSEAGYWLLPPTVCRVGGPAEGGMAMIILLATVMIVTMVSIGLVGVMSTDITHSSIQYTASRAFYVAQAGLEQAKGQVVGAADPAAYTTTDAGVMMPYGGGRFTYWIDAGPAIGGCGPGLKTLEAVGQIAHLTRTFSARVRACGVPGVPFLAALFGVSRLQFQGAASRTYLAPYLVGTPGGGGNMGSFTEIHFADNAVRVNALSEDASETVTLRDGTFFDYALFGFHDRPSYTPSPANDPAPWILSVFGDLVTAQPTAKMSPTPCGTPHACVTVGNVITDVRGVTDLREAMYLRHVYVRSIRKETVPPLDLDPGLFRAEAAQNAANAALNFNAGLRDKRDAVYTDREFAATMSYVLRHPSQFFRGTIFVDGTVLLARSVNLGGPSGNVTLAVAGDLIVGGNATVTNRHDLSTVAGRQTPGIVVFGSPETDAFTRRVCGDQVSRSGRLVVCEGSTVIVDGLVYTRDGMAMRPRAFVDQVGAMYHNTGGTPGASFTNTDATVVLRFDPLALSVFRKGLAIVSWRQLQ